MRSLLFAEDALLVLLRSAYVAVGVVKVVGATDRFDQDPYSGRG